MTDASNGAGQQPERVEIAKRVLEWASGGIIVLGIVALLSAGIAGRDQFHETSGRVFDALLPLLGTWVGTVLAYYFSKANFEAANQSVQNLVQLTLQQKLSKLKVEKEMIPVAKITLFQIPPGKGEKDVAIANLRLMLGGKVTRIPVVDDKGVVQYILHQSTIYKFLSDEAVTGSTSGTDLTKLTLKHFVDKPEIHAWVTALAYVPLQATLADAKAAMERTPNCQDVVITENGRADERMVGWLTNVDIGRLAEV